MILDCHIHITKSVDPKEEFQRKLKLAGVDGAVVFSDNPASFANEKPSADSAQKRLSQVMEYTKDSPNLYPFFFIDPMEEDALEQVDMAVEAGIAGFKVICCHHYPQDDRAMVVWSYIARKNKPITFHSGILYNDAPSAEFNRPGNFEHLFYIKDLRFSMAHISWPWVDELVSVFGKWNYLSGQADSRVTADMYVDLTPGTPAIYREEALTKLISVGYEMMPERMIFGTDGSSTYRSEAIKNMIARDNAIYDKLNVSPEVRKRIFCKNVLSFLGK